jgi:ABC-type polysaccharide/polyol phosphate transport system ATPase subunit
MRKKTKEIAIKMKGVVKNYRLCHEKATLVENILGKSKKEEFEALKGIDLEIKKGEKVGIIGANGSGKTTLLKIISGITAMNKGTIKTNGKLVSLIDLSAGFHPELTGEENIYVNALLVGMEKEEIKSKIKEIIEYADIGKFIDAPLYTYSSGMRLRLGFAVAIESDPDIIILDEEVSAGDEDFQRKSMKKIDEFVKKGKTMLVVSHWLDFLKKHCQRIIWLDEGKIVADGGMEILKKYKLHERVIKDEK